MILDSLTITDHNYYFVETGLNNLNNYKMETKQILTAENLMVRRINKDLINEYVKSLLQNTPENVK